MESTKECSLMFVWELQIQYGMGHGFGRRAITIFSIYYTWENVLFFFWTECSNNTLHGNKYIYTTSNHLTFDSVRLLIKIGCAIGVGRIITMNNVVVERRPAIKSRDNSIRRKTTVSMYQSCFTDFNHSLKHFFSFYHRLVHKLHQWHPLGKTQKQSPITRDEERVILFLMLYLWSDCKNLIPLRLWSQDCRWWSYERVASTYRWRRYQISQTQRYVHVIWKL